MWRGLSIAVLGGLYGYAAVLREAWALHCRFRCGVYGYVAVLGVAWALHCRFRWGLYERGDVSWTRTRGRFMCKGEMPFPAHGRWDVS